MPVAWKINGVAADTFGVGNIRRTLVSQSEDVVTFDAVVADVFAAAGIAYNSTVTIHRDGVLWFTGVSKTMPRISSFQDERITYRIVGAWYWLRHIYRQGWQLHNGTDLETAMKTRVILCQGPGPDYHPITSGAQIEDAVNAAIAAGAPIALGTVDAGISLPYDEDRDLKCADVIQRMLRWHPDWVAWFDYSTSLPTFYCRQASSLAAVNLAATDLASLQLNPRYDLKVPGVQVTFEKTRTIEGLPQGNGTFCATEIQTAGNVSSPESVFATIELAGSSDNYVSCEIKVEPVPPNLTDLPAMTTWWKEHNKSLDGLGGRLVEIGVTTRRNIPNPDHPDWTDLPHILVEGQIQPWMTGSRFKQQQSVFTVKATIRNVNRRDTESGTFTKDYDLLVTTTNLDTRNYSKLDSMDSGEEVTGGLAAALFASWGRLYYEGQVVIDREDVGGILSMGSVVNVIGGLGEWAAMASMVQSITEDVDQGRTTIVVGPPKQVSIDDVVSLLRRFRSRGPAWHAKARETGKAADSGKAIDLGGPMPKHENTSANTSVESLVITGYDADATTGKIDLVPDSMQQYQVLAVEDDDGVLTARFGWVRAPSSMV